VTLTNPQEYPPAVHMLRDLRIEFEHGEGESRAWIPATRAIADARGHVRLGALATLVDVIGGGLAALAAAPGWIATADLTVHRVEPFVANDRTLLEARGRVLRAGRTTVVIECTILGAGSQLAIATMTFSVLDRRDSNPVIGPVPGEPMRHSMALPDSGFDVPLLDALGIELIDPGIASMVIAPYVVNSLGSVQGGALATLAEYAAETLDPSVGTATVDLQLSYLALAKVGPIRAEAVALGGGAVKVEVVDAGAARRATVASARTEPVAT
jgi:acyl-coenzyme A thioesterase PaaI-like protein